jgi:hypothetical protein
MRTPSTPRSTTRWLASAASIVLVALAALAPTGAAAAPNSLKVSTSDAVATGSCEFTVSRVNQNNTGPLTVTARLTIKAAEIKPSFFAPRKVATLSVGCAVYSLSDPTKFVFLDKVNNGSTAYKSRYVELILSEAGYRACVNVTYVLRDGTLGSAPGACNPPV